MNKDKALEAHRALAVHYRETFEATTYKEVTIIRSQFNCLIAEIYRHDGAMDRRKNKVDRRNTLPERRTGEGDGISV